ncbi:MAG: ECF transporter S component [Clostridia bacterium]
MYEKQKKVVKTKTDEKSSKVNDIVSLQNEINDSVIEKSEGQTADKLTEKSSKVNDIVSLQNEINDSVIEKSESLTADKITEMSECKDKEVGVAEKQKKATKISRLTTRNIAFTALFTALVYATTMIAIPNGVGGIINFGDAMILVCATVMNPYSAMIAGSVGASLADITIPGCIVWAPFTLVIKSVMACVCGFVIRAIKKYATGGIKQNKPLWITFSMLSFVAAELVMVIGYFGASYIVSKFNLAMAITQFASNFIQMAIAIAVASILIYGVRLDKIFNKIYNKK